ncbi:GNAT family N-acetyltransferase [Saccharopolyspora sp. CA-218241]|uniref:GNAT family N-acetyltransferase n=1 Tax=Saccharopolyspora sp. CA-218241 TaxID=3240027 RepID=UPI003D96766C
MVSIERTTGRLRLRPVRGADLDAFVGLETALRAREAPPRAAPDRDESARFLDAFVRAWADGPLGYWAVERDDQVVGFGGVQPKEWRGQRCWNLYYRVDPGWWGRGIATEVAREAIAAGAEARPGWPVLVETRPGNTAAIRVAERAGLVRQDARPGDEYAVLLLRS